MAQTPKPSVLITEFGTGHSELFYSHALLLHHLGYKVHFLLAQNLQGLEPTQIPLASVTLVNLKGPFKALRLSFTIKKLIKKHRITHIMHNTASGNLLRSLCHLLPKKVMQAGVLHQANKLKDSSSQRIITKRVKHYLVLSQLIWQQNHQHIPQDVHVNTFYPCYFPPAQRPQPPQTPIRICIPGLINFNKRAYLWLSQWAAQHQQALQNQIQFVILGNALSTDGPAYKAEIEKNGLQNIFTLFEGFIDNETYYNQIASCHIIMPLLHPEIRDFERYKKDKISGAFNLAIGFQKPMLLHKSLSQFEEFTPFSIPYTTESTLQAIQQVKQQHPFQEIIKAYQENARFTVSAQAKEYQKLLNIQD